MAETLYPILGKFKLDCALFVIVYYVEGKGRNSRKTELMI